MCVQGAVSNSAPPLECDDVKLVQNSRFSHSLTRFPIITQGHLMSSLFNCFRLLSISRGGVTRLSPSTPMPKAREKLIN